MRWRFEYAAARISMMFRVKDFLWMMANDMNSI
jgi:hypothetical protein